MIDTDIRTLFSVALGDGMPAYPTPDEDVARGRRFRRRRRQRQAIGGLAVASVVAVAVTLIPGSPVNGADLVAGPEDASLTSDIHPRILLDHPEWEVRSAEIDQDGGTITYWRGAERFHIDWYRFDDPETTGLYNYRSQGVPETPAAALGRDARIFEPADGFYELIWQEDGLEVGVSGSFGALAEFQELLGDLYEADDETWRALMKDATRRFDNAEAIEEIAASVPVDDHFWSRVEGRLDWIDPADEHLLTQEVLHWAACGWVRQRLDGYENQDPSYVDDELAEVLDFAQANNVVTDERVWDYAEAIVTGEETVNGRPLYDLFYASEALRCGGW